ncbi:MAG TPA: multicopper oxidase domain-containing protein, partial [Candidatus Bathyarchaeia archaeon]|nr:multicopper oxidase domain-containing protein [Candidatus Bathyarchaeia archaeon]
MAGFREKRLTHHAVEAAIIMAMLATSILTSPLLDPTVSGQSTTPAYAPNISKSATDLPAVPSLSDKVVVTLVTKEVLGQLADGTTYTYWTYNGTVPGPFIRLRVGQVVTMHMKNPANSTMTHSIDSHGIMGPGGGSALSQTAPGNESVFQFTAVYPGLFVYHCGTPDIPTHIANGMYGMMLIEPKDGLSRADEEFYVEQGEVYTIGGYGQQGHQDFSFQKAQAETPDYVVFNGRVGALTGNRTMRVKVGDTVRVFFGNIGPNLVSSLHIIGGILNRVYLEGSLISPPVMDLQTTLVPAGGTVMIEFTAQTPGIL